MVRLDKEVSTLILGVSGVGMDGVGGGSLNLPLRLVRAAEIDSEVVTGEHGTRPFMPFFW